MNYLTSNSEVIQKFINDLGLKDVLSFKIEVNAHSCVILTTEHCVPSDVATEFLTEISKYKLEKI